MTEPLDHAIETLLRDELASRRPTDLTDRVLSAVQSGPRQSPAESRLAPGRRSGRRELLLGIALGAVAASVIGFWHLHFPADGTPPTALRVAGHVMQGTLTWQSAAPPGRVSVSATDRGFALPLQRGDHLVAAPSQRLHIAFDQHGRLELQPATCLEVTNVEWKPLTGGFVAGSITVTALVGAATWYGDGQTVDGPDGSLVIAASPGTGVTPAAATGSARELAIAHRRIAELENQLQDRTAAMPDRPVPDDPLPAGAAIDDIATGSVFDSRLAAVDWQTVGTAVTGYLDVQKQIELLRAAGEPVPMELQATADRCESTLFEQLASTLEDGVPGVTVAAQIHHPAIMTNLFHSAMAAAGMPLDETQRRWLTDIGQRYVAEDAARRAGYGPDTMDLERAVDEIQMQHRCIAEQRRMLRPEQEAVLSFGELGERAGIDPFGSGYQWSKNNRVLEVADRAALAQRASSGYASELGLTDSQTEVLRPMIERWVSRWPALWLDRPMDDYDRNSRIHIERIRTAATLQVDLMREMAHGLGLSPEQLERLRRQSRIFIPFLRP
ncbi:MAG: hypothetical protein NXI31_17750 [bacterium]|nr:hypothetical protein [bacterium]